jgi:hypothetical protein
MSHDVRVRRAQQSNTHGAPPLAITVPTRSAQERRRTWCRARFTYWHHHSLWLALNRYIAREE